MRQNRGTTVIDLVAAGKHRAHYEKLWVKSRSNTVHTVGTPKGLGILGLVTLGCKDICEVKMGGIGSKGI